VQQKGRNGDDIPLDDVGADVPLLKMSGEKTADSGFRNKEDTLGSLSQDESSRVSQKDLGGKGGMEGTY